MEPPICNSVGRMVEGKTTKNLFKYSIKMICITNHQKQYQSILSSLHGAYTFGLLWQGFFPKPVSACKEYLASCCFYLSSRNELRTDDTKKTGSTYYDSFERAGAPVQGALYIRD